MDSSKPIRITNLADLLHLKRGLKRNSIFRGENDVFDSLKPRIGRILPELISTAPDYPGDELISRSNDRSPDEQGTWKVWKEFLDKFDKLEKNIIMDFQRRKMPFSRDSMEDIGFRRMPNRGDLGLIVNKGRIAVLGQHHGLPTRLLDWTTNILVALYFALDQGNLDATRTVWILDTDREPLREESIFPKSFGIVSPMHIHQRVIRGSSHNHLSSQRIHIHS